VPATQRNAEQIVDLVDYDRSIQRVISQSSAMEGDLRDNGTVGQILEEMQGDAEEALKLLVEIDPDEKLQIVGLQGIILRFRETAARAAAIIEAGEIAEAEHNAEQMIEE